MARKEYDFSGFTGVEARNAMKVEVKRGDTFSVAVEADDQALGDVNVTMFNNMLTAKLEARWGHIGMIFKGRSSPKLLVTMPDTPVAGTGRRQPRGDFRFYRPRNLPGDTVRGQFAYGGRLRQADETGRGAPLLTSNSAAAPTAQISNLSAASNANLEKMTVGDARIKLGGAASMTIDVTGKLDAAVSGASNLKWLGTPTLGDVRITGASSFSKKS
jgi:hypothetical protein